MEHKNAIFKTLLQLEEWKQKTLNLSTHMQVLQHQTTQFMQNPQFIHTECLNQSGQIAYTLLP